MKVWCAYFISQSMYCFKHWVFRQTFSWQNLAAPGNCLKCFITVVSNDIFHLLKLAFSLSPTPQCHNSYNPIQLNEAQWNLMQPNAYPSLQMPLFHMCHSFRGQSVFRFTSLVACQRKWKLLWDWNRNTRHLAPYKVTQIFPFLTLTETRSIFQFCCQIPKIFLWPGCMGEKHLTTSAPISHIFLSLYQRQ